MDLIDLYVNAPKELEDFIMGIRDDIRNYHEFDVYYDFYVVVNVFNLSYLCLHLF